MQARRIAVVEDEASIAAPVATRPAAPRELEPLEQFRSLLGELDFVDDPGVTQLRQPLQLVDHIRSRG